MFRDQVTFRFGVFEVDARSGELRKSGLRVKLQEKPFQFLVTLLERPGELVTRDELRQRLWPSDTFVEFDRSLNVAVRRLRSALNDTAEVPRFVETLRGRGYRFIAPVDLGEPVPASRPPAVLEGAHADKAIPPAVSHQPYPPAERGALGVALESQLRPKLKIVSTTVERDRDLRYQRASSVVDDMRGLKRDTGSGRAVLGDSDSQVIARLGERHNSVAVATSELSSAV